MQTRTKIAASAGATGRVGRHVVDVLRAGGHEVVAMSRASGVDVISGDGLAGSRWWPHCSRPGAMTR